MASEGNVVVANGPRARVVVVDDQPFVDLLREVLADRYQVVAVPHDRLSRRRIAQTRPDVLMIDLDLRRDDGLASFRQLRSDSRLMTVPTIVCSADVYALRDVEPALAALNPLTVLPKPFSLDELESVLAGALPSAEAQASVSGAGR
jgi:CheY-like chemotaxis protein